MRHGEKYWKIDKCDAPGPCWCRKIITTDGEDVLDAGRVDQEFAEWVVWLHNARLFEDEAIEEAMKLADGLVE